MTFLEVLQQLQLLYQSINHQIAFSGNGALGSLGKNGDVRFMQLDMSDPNSIKRFVNTIAHELPGQISALVSR